MKTIAILLLAACGTTDPTGSPDAAGTSEVACSEFSAGYLRAPLNATCSFSLAGVDWLPVLGQPGVLGNGASGDNRIEFIGADLYRADFGYAWSQDTGQRGVAVKLNKADQCVWLRCAE